MENRTIPEALKLYPFRDIALNQEIALDVSTQKTHTVLKKNMSLLKPQEPQNRLLLNHIKHVEKTLPEGGLSFEKDQLNSLYENYDKYSFPSIIEVFTEDVFPRRLKEENQIINPGIICIGYLLDLLRIINPKIASFDDGVQVIAETTKKKATKTTPFLLGAMIDDAIHLRGTLALPFAYQADKEGAEQLRNSYLHVAGLKEQKEFENGIKISREEVYLGVTGKHLN